eukprot:scaffold35016_cov92-Skeletonema_marinoi.AAC.2
MLPDPPYRQVVFGVLGRNWEILVEEKMRILPFIPSRHRWNGMNLSDSRYVWLPIEFGVAEDEVSPMIHWQDEWDVSKAWN